MRVPFLSTVKGNGTYGRSEAGVRVGVCLPAVPTHTVQNPKHPVGASRGIAIPRDVAGPTRDRLAAGLSPFPGCVRANPCGGGHNAARVVRRERMPSRSVLSSAVFTPCEEDRRFNKRVSRTRL